MSIYTTMISLRVTAFVSLFLMGGVAPVLAQVLPDQDGDGAPDTSDSCTYVSNSPASGPFDQVDSDDDGIGNHCDCDFNNDGACNIQDFSLFRLDYISRRDSGAGTDMNADGVVSIADFSLFLQGFISGAPGPSGLLSNRSLFLDLPPPSGLIHDTPPGRALRVRFAKVNGRYVSQALDELDSSIEVNLFSDSRATMQTQYYAASEHASGQEMYWRGVSDDEEVVTVIESPDGLVGQANLSAGDFRFHPTAAPGWHAIVQFGPFPPDDPPLAQAAALRSANNIQARDTASQSCDKPSCPPGVFCKPTLPTPRATIDVAVFYTPRARMRSANISADVALMMEKLSDAFSLSSQNFFVVARLVHSGEVNYVESGDMDMDLRRLTSTSDGHMDNVHAIRNQTRADLVALITEDNSDYCGTGWIGGGANLGFSVTDRWCGVGDQTFSHELGHNLGMEHDLFVLNTPGIAHGYTSPTTGIRTIMAYRNECESRGFTTCVRLGVYSNPRAFSPKVGVLGIEGRADNTEQLCRSATLVEGYR